MKLNVNQITSIAVFENEKADQFSYESEKNYFFFKRKEGFYATYPLCDSYYVSEEKIKSAGKYEIRGKEVYLKPNIEIKMSDGSVKLKYFENMEWLRMYLESPELKTVKFINI